MSTRPLRIGIFVMTFPQLSETFIVTKVLKLLANGFDVHVFAATESKHWEAFDVLAGRDDVRARVHVLAAAAAPPRAAVDLASSALEHPASLVRFIRHNVRTRREIRTSLAKSIYLRRRFVGFELDILHIEFDAQGIGIADLKEFFGCHILYSARGTFQQTTVLDTTPDACEYLFRYVDGYHFISRFLEQNTRKLGLPDDVPTWLIEPAIDLTLFRPTPRINPNGTFEIVSVGRLAWAKGYEFALDTIARVRAAGVDARYTIYGSGSYEEPIRFAIQQLGLTEFVRLAGAFKREAMPAAYAKADLMLHAAVEEGFCNAVIEAQAMELPVVTSDAGGLPENVEHGVTGFVVPRRDSDAMAERVLQLAHDPALRKRLGEAGRRRAITRFDLDRQADAFVQLYTELAALPRRKAPT